MRNLSPGFKCIISLSLKPISDKHYTHLKFKHTVLGYTLQLTGLLVSDCELGVYVRGEGIKAWRLPLWLESGSEVQTQYTYTNWWPDVYRSGLKAGLRFKPSTHIPTDGLTPTALAWKRVWGSNPVHIYQLMAYRSGLKAGLRFKPSTHIPTDGLPLWLENGSEVQTQYTYTNWWPTALTWKRVWSSNPVHIYQLMAYRCGLKTGLRIKPSTHIPTDRLISTALAWKRVWGSNPVHIYQLMAYRSGLKAGLRFKPSTHKPTDGLPLWLENGSEVQSQYTYTNWWPTALAWKRVWGSNPVHIYQLMAYRSGLKTGLRFKPSTHIPTDGLPLWLENGSEVQTQYTYTNWWPAAYRSGLKTGLRFKPSTHIPTDGLPLWLENGSEVQTQYTYTNWWPTALAWKRVWGSNPVHIYQLMAYRSGLKTGLRFKPSTHIPTDGLPLWLENGSEVQTQYIYTNWWPTALTWKRVWGSNPVHIYQLMAYRSGLKTGLRFKPSTHIPTDGLPLWLENGSEVQTQYIYTNWWPTALTWKRVWGSNPVHIYQLMAYRSGLKTGLRFKPSTHIPTDGLISTAVAWKRVWGSNPVHIYQLMAWYLPLWLENGSEVQTQYTYTNWWPDIYRSGLKWSEVQSQYTYTNWWPTALASKRVWGSNPVHIYQLMAWYLPLWLENGSEVQTQYTYTNWWPTALAWKRVWGSNPVHIYQLMAWYLPLWLENGSEVQTQYTYTNWWPDIYRSGLKTGLRFNPSTHIPTDGLPLWLENGSEVQTQYTYTNWWPTALAWKRVWGSNPVHIYQLMAWYLPLWLENGSEVQTQYTYTNWWPDIYRSGLKTGLRFNPSTHIPTDGLPLWLENGSEVQTQYTYTNWWPDIYRSGLKTGLRFKPSTHTPTDGLISTALAWKRVWGSNPVHIYQLMAWYLPLWLENGSEVQTQYIYTNWWPTALAWKRVWGSNPVHIYQLMAYRSDLKTGLRFKPSTHNYINWWPTAVAWKRVWGSNPVHIYQLMAWYLPLWLESGSEVQTQYTYTNWWPTALAWKRVWGSNPVHIYQLMAYRSDLKTGLRFNPSTHIPTDGLPLWLENGSEVQTQYTYTNWWPTALAWKRVWGSNPVHIYQLMAWYLPLWLENGSEVQTQYTYTNWWPDIYRSGLKTGLRFKPSTHIPTDGLISTALAWKRVWGSNPVHIYQLMAWYLPLWLENGSEVQTQYTYTNWWPTALAWKRVWGSNPVHIYQLMAWYLPLWLENGSEVQTQYTYTNWWPTALAWKRVWGSNPVHIYQLMAYRSGLKTGLRFKLSTYIPTDGLPLWLENGSEVQTQYTYTNWWPDIYRSGLKTGLRFKPSTHIPTDGLICTALAWKRVWGSNPVHI